MQQLMRGMDLTPFLFIIGFLLVAAGIIIFAGLHARRRAGLIRAMPTSNIGMAQDGYCEFEGMIEAIGGAQMIAPLTLTPCAWYNAKLEKWTRGTNNRSGSWTTVRESTSGAPLLLRDATGVCLVFPFLAEVTPTDKSQWTGGTAVPAERNPPRFGPGGSSTPAFQVSGGPNSRFRYTEERIYVGDPLFVLGEFSSRQFEPHGEDEDDVEEFDDDPIDEGEDGTAESSREAIDEEEEEQVDAADDPGDWNDSRSEDLTALAEQTTRACVRKGSSSKPFIMSTTLQPAHVYMSEVGGQVALYLGALPLGLVALLLYARYG